MILVLDIGNTNIHTGIYKSDRLIKTENWITSNGIEKRILKILSRKKIEGIGIASVVPELNQKLKIFFEKKFRIKPLFISAKIKMPVEIAYKDLGADRIANIVGAYVRYSCNFMVFSFGTAITGDAVLKSGVHLGGLIMPGMETQLWSLNEKTALIKNITLTVPKNLLGRNTNDCVRSGIFNGTRLAIQEFIREVCRTSKNDFKIIATGGWGKKMFHYIPQIDRYDRDLTLYGILKLYYYNAKK